MWHAWERTQICESLVENPEENGSLGRPTCHLEDNIKTEIQEIGWEVRNGLMSGRIGTIVVLLWTR
jgi:hypothetical protein